MSIVSLIIYIPLQILFIPFAVLGFFLVGYKQLVVSKRLGISQTAIEVLHGRWTMHVFGMRDDEATAKITEALPNASPFGLWLVLFPLWVKTKISGRLSFYPRNPEPGSEGLADLVTARTIYFDRVIRRVVGEVEQFVVMGAGYDMRAYGELQHAGVKFFELDQVKVQEHKRAYLKSANISTEHVCFVSIDFANEEVFDKLTESDFDPAKKTLFLWEGVTLYLKEADVRTILQKVRGRAAKGSVLLADLYAERMVSLAKKGALKKSLDYTNEGLGFSIDLTKNYEVELSKFVESESLVVGETFFMGSNNEKGPLMVVVEMKTE